jgi:hypothetical protein
MHVRQKFVLYLFPLIILFSLATDALASCPSIHQGPPCQEYWQTEAVFIGTANRVVRTPLNPELAGGLYFRSTAYFTVEEAFKGVATPGIVFNLDHCGYAFKENERYLVYAHRNPNNNELDVRAGFTRTQPLSAATEDLQYIRGLSSSESGASVFGKVTQYAHNLKENRFESDPLQNITVILEGNNQRQEVITDSEGRYEFKGIAKGTYKVRAEIPAFLSYDEQTFNLIGRECVPLNISATRKGMIAGRVLDINGKPLGSVPVTLVPADATLEQIRYESKEKIGSVMTFTDRQGRYGFTQLVPGRYLLLINRSESDKALGSAVSRALPLLFYPGVSDLGGATIIVLGQDDKPQEYVFRLTLSGP